MMNLTDVESAFLEKANKYFGLLKTKQKTSKKKTQPFSWPNYRNSSLAARLSFFAYVLLGQACKLHVFYTATTDITFIKIIMKQEDWIFCLFLLGLFLT